MLQPDITTLFQEFGDHYLKNPKMTHSDLQQASNLFTP